MSSTTRAASGIDGGGPVGSGSNSSELVSAEPTELTPTIAAKSTSRTARIAPPARAGRGMSSSISWPAISSNSESSMSRTD